MKNSVSVIIPTYNRSALIARAVTSALAASIPGDEIIVIDDGSTDDTATALKPYYGKIEYFQTERRGPGAARNYGIGQATCPLVSFLDSDDEWFPDKLYLQRHVMDAFPDLIYCFSDLQARLPDGETVHNILNLWQHDQWVGSAYTRSGWNEILGPGVAFSSIAELGISRMDFNIHIGSLYANLMEVYYVWTSSIMVRKELAGASFKFAEDQHICEDWECFARLAKVGPVAFLNCETAVQHVHRDPRLTDVGNIEQASARIKLLQRVWGADESVLNAHSSRFDRILKEQYFRRAKYLIKAGRIKEAKEDLMVLDGGPWLYRMLTILPAPLLDGLIRLRSILLGLRKQKKA